MCALLPLFKGKILDFWSDFFIIKIPKNITEDICIKKDIVRYKPLFRLHKKSGDGFYPVFFCTGHRKFKSGCIRKQNIIELYLIKSILSGLYCNIGVIFPYLLFERIHPRKIFSV